MIFFPAIDLKGGHCVRLEQGDMERATVFSPDPASQALEFEDAECAWLHVVDLDGAFAGRSINGAAVESVLAATTLRVQLGGGIRDVAGIEAWLKKGVSRVVLGTIALRDPELVKQACKEFPGQVAVGIDGRGGRVAVEGWAETSDVEVRELALMFEDAGAAAIIYTDIERDGVMEGPNVAGIVALAKAITTPVIASGGVSSMDDLRALKEAGEGQLLGVIAGRSVYDGRVDPAEAVKLLGG